MKNGEVVNGRGGVCSSETVNGGEDVFSCEKTDASSADHLVIMVHGILGRCVYMSFVFLFDCAIHLCSIKVEVVYWWNWSLWSDYKGKLGILILGLLFYGKEDICLDFVNTLSVSIFYRILIKDM